jgi:hypothetical protein
VIYIIPFLQRAGLMTFDHRKPDELDYRRNLPIVTLTLDAHWDPQCYYDELLGFIPEDPGSDTYIFAIREANAFRMLCEDPNVFLDIGEEWYDSHSDMMRGGPTTQMNIKTEQE